MIESFNFSDGSSLSKEFYDEWLAKSMSKGIDCIETDSNKESVNIIDKILRILTKSPYKQEASIYRLHSKKLLPNTEVQDKYREWAHQLINISSISEKKALKIISKFPSMSLLMEYYQDPKVSLKEKRSIFATVFERKEKRLSEKIYTVYTSINPDEII